MAAKKPKLDVEIVRVTPSMAAQILEGNTRNRSLRPHYVHQLAGAMERGEWVNNGEPIQVARDHTLLNGQHRLRAVIESGVSVPMLVVRGLPVTAQKTMDVGARRTLSDVLALHGEQDTTSLGAVLGLLHRYRAGARLDYSGRTAPTVTEALELLRLEPGIAEALPEGRQIRERSGMRMTVGSVLFYLFEEVDPGTGRKFFEALCDPAGEESWSAVRRLRAHIDRVRRSRKYSFSTVVLSAVTIKAFNAWREGRPVEVLAYRADGKKKNVEPFPRILTPDEIKAARKRK